MARMDYVIKAEVDGDAVATDTAGSYQTACEAARLMRVANPTADIVVIDTYRNEDTAVYSLLAPKPGMPATYAIGSDCYGYEVVEVSKSGKSVKLRRIGTTGYVSEDARLNKHGYFKPVGGCGTISFGQAREYRDPSF